MPELNIIRSMKNLRSPEGASAAMGCMLIAAQAYFHLVHMVSYPVKFDGSFLVQTAVETLVGTFVLALPAMIFLTHDEVGVWIKRTAFIYPLFLALGFWQGAIINDGLGYALLFAYILLPLASAYGFIVLLDVHITKKRRRSR